MLDRGLKVKVLGTFCLSISHRVTGKVVREQLGKLIDGAVWHSGGGALAGNHSECEPPPSCAALTAGFSLQEQH